MYFALCKLHLNKKNIGSRYFKKMERGGGGGHLLLVLTVGFTEPAILPCLPSPEAGSHGSKVLSC